MKRNGLLDNFAARNGLGILALLGVHYLSDLYSVGDRTGFSKVLPYLYLLLLYGWLIFHDRILFARLFLRGKKRAYFGWLLLLTAVQSVNMHFVLRTQFNVSHSLPHLVSFWVYTVTGLGVYISWRHLYAQKQAGTALTPSEPATTTETGNFSCMVDGEYKTISYADIWYLESLENYLKVITKSKTYVTRLTLKEAEERLPKQQFVRISRSYVVNMAFVERREPDTIWIDSKMFRIGKTYKRYVIEQFADT